MAVEYGGEDQTQPQNQQQQPKPRWSHHLANNPYGDDSIGNWAKQYYDNPNIDPGAAVQGQLSQFRSQYGAAAPADDISALRMIASGQAPEAPQAQPSVTSPQISTGQFPVQQYPQQLSTITAQPRNNDLYNVLMRRAQQGLQVDRTDPVIQAQSDAYRANEERARRQYLAEAAEKQGPYGNQNLERRMTAEGVGQRSGAFEAQLLGRELQAKRDEIAQSLSQLGSMLSDDQRLALQRELGLLDAAIRNYSVTSSADIARGQLALGQGQLDLSLADLGLRSEQQNSYWDWIRRGGNLG